MTKTIPRGSLRHVDQNIETAYSHFYGLSYQHEMATALTGASSTPGRAGRKLYDLSDPNKPGAALVYLGIWHRNRRARIRSTRRSTRAATAAVRSTTA